ncbi:hypothetical protein B7P43_G16958 [Cryptotermes secundus]|uniref:Uncharacterized protein n=1 Tax=Cryptotermes secundus TaxID=105785 RepID=A0A2J7REJ2_9NEOP|nr:hypothetical protein B7P43_G16958 [Cryptotermes secundus]
MPPLKQPPSLESIVLQSVNKFTLALGHKLLDEVCSGTPTTVPPTRWGMSSNFVSKKPSEILNSQEMQHFFHPGLPLYLSNAVTSVALKAITTIISQAKCTHDGFSKSGDDSCREIVESLISIVLRAQLTHFDLLKWPWFIGETLLKHLHIFHHLEVLKLWPVTWSPVWATVVEVLQGGYCSLSNLVSFSMRCHCTDKILILMVSCTRLQYLDVMSSVEVTDLCVSSLLHLNNLKVMNMCSTSLTAVGYTRLLNGLPHLGKLVWFDLNSKALGSMKTSPLSLLSYEASRVSLNQLIIIVRMCPYLIQISLHWVEADLSVLGELKQLKEIKIAHCSAVNSNLKGLLEVVGYNIASLELHEMKDVDLLMIGALCINLKRMGLMCDFKASEESFLAIKEPLFKELEDLRFGSEYSECLFFSCINIRKLEVSKCQNFNDHVVAALLTRNPLKQLEVLSVGHSGLLSMNTVHLLLESCDNLRVLEGLESWGGVTKSQVMELCADMKRKNMDIEILWKKPLQISW